MARIDTVTKRVSKRVDLYRDEADSWKQDHQIAIACFDIQQALVEGNQLFEFLIQFDEGWQAIVFDDPAAYSDEAQQVIDNGMMIWLQSSKKIIDCALRFQCEYLDRGFDVKHIRAMEKNIAQMEMMLADQTEFFSRGNLDELRDAAIDEHRSGLTEAM